MQVEVDVKCMQTNFGGRGLSGFGVMASFCLPSKMAKISLRTMDYSHTVHTVLYLLLLLFNQTVRADWALYGSITL